MEIFEDYYEKGTSLITYNRNIRSPFNARIDFLFEELKKEKSLSFSQAIFKSNEIVKEIEKLIEKEKYESEDKQLRSENLIMLYKRAADAYILASDKIGQYKNMELIRSAKLWESLAEKENWSRVRI